MEAAGIEPASRNVSAQTSTCVSGQFKSRGEAPGRQGAFATSPKLIWPYPYQAVKQGESDLATDWEVLPTGTIARGGLIKQPEKTELRQLKLWSTFFVACRPTTARNLNLLPSGRNQYAPVNALRDRHEVLRAIPLRWIHSVLHRRPGNPDFAGTKKLYPL